MHGVGSVFWDGFAWSTLAFAALAFGWLGLRGWRPQAPFVPDALAAARRVAGRAPLAGGRPRSRGRDERDGQGFRLPATMPERGGGAIPADVAIAFRILCAAIEQPGTPPPPVLDAIAARRAGKGPPEDALAAWPAAAGRAVDDVLYRHAWWETILVELHARARDSGSWLAPVHLAPFLGDRTDVLDAMRASSRGAVPVRGAAILAHWQAERAAGSRIRQPVEGPVA